MICNGFSPWTMHSTLDFFLLYLLFQLDHDGWISPSTSRFFRCISSFTPESQTHKLCFHCLFRWLGFQLLRVKRPSDILGSHVSVYSLRFASCGEATSGKGAHGGSFFQEWGAQLLNLIPAWVVMWCTIYWGVKDLWAKLLPWKVIIQQGNPGTTFYILFEGEVAVSIAPRWCFFFVQLVKQRGLEVSWCIPGESQLHLIQQTCFRKFTLSWSIYSTILLHPFR